MSIPNGYQRAIHKTVAQEVAKRVGVEADDWMQDWPYEVCAFDRVPEFVRRYSEEVWTEDERFALMQLILYSLDDVAETKHISSHPLWTTVAGLLEREPKLHASSILELGCVCDRESTDDHPIAPLLQELYETRLRDELPL